jgi:hypothetical protein
MHYRLSAIGYRLSAIGYRLSAIGYRLSAIGYRLLSVVRRQNWLKQNGEYQLPNRITVRLAA